MVLWDMNEEARAFSRRYFAQIGSMPSFNHAGVYSAVGTYLKAVTALGTDAADAVMPWLRQHRINDMFAKNGYIRQDGCLMHDMYLMQVKSPAVWSIWCSVSKFSCRLRSPGACW